MRETGYDSGYKQGLRDGRNGLSFNKNRGLAAGASRAYASEYREGYEEGYYSWRDSRRSNSRDDRRDDRRDRRDDEDDREENGGRLTWLDRLANLFAGTKHLGRSVAKGASQLTKIQAKSRRVQCNEKLEYGEPYDFEEGSFVCIYDDN